MTKWKDIILEQGNQGYQIYCDLDGVLCAMEKGALKKINDTLQRIGSDQEYYSNKSPKFYRRVQKAADQLGGWHVEATSRHIEKHGSSPAVRQLMYTVVANDKSFWANLEWLEGGKELWNYIKPYNPIILTAPMNTENSAIGKREWCQKNLGLSGNRVIVSKFKGIKTLVKSILIDDREKYLSQFRKGGNIGIQHIPGHADNTIAQLKGYGF